MDDRRPEPFPFGPSLLLLKPPPLQAIHTRAPGGCLDLPTGRLRWQVALDTQRQQQEKRV